MRHTVKHYYRLGGRFNATKYKVWMFLQLREQQGCVDPLNVGELAYWTGVRKPSLHVLVTRWRSASWRRILKRKRPDGSIGYVLGCRGRQWLKDAELFIPEALRDAWYDEIVDHQQAIIERKRDEDARLEARIRFHAEHGF
jgi:hypothetical protein